MILFRSYHQQAAQSNKRLLWAFWLGILFSYLCYVIFVGGLISLYVYAFLARLGSHPESVFPVFKVAFAVALIPTLITLNVYDSKLVEFKSRSAEDFARQLGAKPININHQSEKKLARLVEEMSIASGITMPAVLILPRDESINAFLLAGKNDSLALAVSQGALTHLSRDELQAVIAYQFGHLKDGFLPVFTRLAAMTAAYSAIVEYCSDESRVHTAVEQNLFHPFHSHFSQSILGQLFTVFGTVFYHYGLWLQSAFSRERVKMGDARAVQYTRYPAPLICALKKATVLAAQNARSVPPPRYFAHMYFIYQQSAAAWRNTHPLLSARVEMLGGRVSEEDLAALLFEMNEKDRAKNAVESPAERYRAALEQPLLYPLLIVDQTIARQNFPPPEDPAAALLALFLYHSGASIFNLTQQELFPPPTLQALSKALSTIENTPPLAQIALLPFLTQAASKCPEQTALQQEIKKLVKLNGKLTDYEACALMCWQAAIQPDKEHCQVRDCQRELAELFAFLAEDDQEEYQHLIIQLIPKNPPAFSFPSASRTEQLLKLCQTVRKLRQLSASYRRILWGIIADHYQRQGKITLRQAYFRHTLQTLFIRPKQ